MNETEIVNDNKGLKGEGSRQIKEDNTDAVVLARRGSLSKPQ